MDTNQKLQDARTRYGRPFQHELIQPRRTPPSPRLEELNRLSQQTQAA
jgi:hypothetical protein